MTDLVERLRDTPNWMRESFGSWKDCVLKYDRAPFEAADEITRLRAEVEALRADAERLDWIGRQCLDELHMSLVIDAPHDGEILVYGDGDSFGYGATLRAAIDAARKA